MILEVLVRVLDVVEAFHLQGLVDRVHHAEDKGPLLLDNVAPHNEDHSLPADEFQSPVATLHHEHSLLGQVVPVVCLVHDAPHLILSFLFFSLLQFCTI